MVLGESWAGEVGDVAGVLAVAGAVLLALGAARSCSAPLGGAVVDDPLPPEGEEAAGLLAGAEDAADGVLGLEVSPAASGAV